MSMKNVRYKSEYPAMSSTLDAVIMGKIEQYKKWWGDAPSALWVSPDVHRKLTYSYYYVPPFKQTPKQNYPRIFGLEIITAKGNKHPLVGQLT